MTSTTCVELAAGAFDRFNISRERRHARSYFMTTEVLGEGTFGKVYTAYRAVDHRLWQRVAVKEIHIADAADPGLVDRLVTDVGREGALMYNAKSPRVVSVYQPWFDEARCVLCIPQERCDESLERYRLRHDPCGIPLAALRSIFAQCLEALVDLRKAGTVHSDIKPDNVMLVWARGPDAGLPEVKLADFGLGAPAYEIAALTSPNPIGTPLFMAPECYTLDGATAPYARDVWSMGCLFHQLLTGRYPFMAASHEELRVCVNAAVVVPFPELPDLDPTRRFLYHLTCSIFTPSPTARPTAMELRDAFLREVSIHPSPVTPLPVARTYRRMAVCRAQQQRIHLFSAPSISLGFVIEQFLVAGATDVFVLNESIADRAAPCPSRRSLGASHLPLLPHGRAAVGTTPMSSSCLPAVPYTTASADVGGPEPQVTWHYVVYPLRGFCPTMQGGRPTLHDCVDLPELPCEAAQKSSAPLLDPSQLQQQALVAVGTPTAMSPGPSPHAPTPYNPKLRVSAYRALFSDLERG